MKKQNQVKSDVVTQKMSDGRVRVVSPHRYSLVVDAANLLKQSWIVKFGNSELIYLRGEKNLTRAVEIAQSLAARVRSPEVQNFRAILSEVL
ncbi:hypothetical protein [Reinekea sp. G2M2-21]|uniref:hypothetical protein n=1 Tax=Reinekea sp. G2M2-21 TaxID=2788942 RepID=UPI0018AB1ABE|nr:hypothetical protein [Reinekea sp. G2M2-21]